MLFNMQFKFWNRPTRSAATTTARLRVEQFEDRIVPAVTFDINGDLLTVRGTDGDDIIAISRRVEPNGALAVLNVDGVESSVLFLNGKTIQVIAGKGNDIVVMDESTAVTWSARLYGEAGKDLLVGASRNDYIHGGAGNDSLMGRAGDDILVGGAGRDEIYGGAGADIIQAIDGSIDWIYADIDDLVAKDKKDYLIFV